MSEKKPTPQECLDKADQYVELGKQCAIEDDYENAEAQFRMALANCNQALKLDPNYADAYFQRYRLFWVLEEYDKALADLTKILTLDLSAANLADIYNERGNIYFDLGQYERAFDDYSNIIELHPDDPQTYRFRADKHALLGDKYSSEENNEKAQNQYRLALDDCNKAIELAPGFTEYRLYKARLLSVLLRYDQAIEGLSDLLKLNLSYEDQADVYYARGDINFAHGHHKKAFKDYGKIIKLHPESPQAYYIRANQYAARGDQFSATGDNKKAKKRYRLALEDYNQALELDSNYADAYFQRSRLFLVLDKYDKAISDLTKILNLDLPEAGLAAMYNERGDIYFDLGQRENAFNDYGKMIELLPGEPQNYHFRAGKHAHLGDKFSSEDDDEKAHEQYRLALKDCEKAIELSPDVTEFKLFQARLLFVLQQYDQAMEGLSDLLKLDLPREDKADVYYARGDMKFAHGHHKKAFKDYGKMIKLLPEFPMAYYVRANQHAAMADQFSADGDSKKAKEQYRLALEDCNQALKLDSNYAEAYYQRSRLFSVFGEHDKAIADLTKILALDLSVTDLPDIYNERGNIFFAQQQYEKAFDDYSKIIELLPGEPQAYRFRAGQYATLGDQYLTEENNEKAQEQYRLALEDCDKAIALNPDFTEFRLFYARLLSALQQYDRAIDGLSDLLKLDLPQEDKADVYYGSGDINFAHSRYKEAFEDYKEMIKLLPKSPMAYYIRANQYAARGDQLSMDSERKKAEGKYHLALKDCDQAIKYDSDYIDAIHLRSKLYSSLKEYDEAFADLKRLLTLDLTKEDRAIVYSERGDIYFDQEKYEDAFADYNDMIALLPGEPQTYFIRASKYAIYGDQLLLEGDHEKAHEQYHSALADLNKAIELDPKEIEYYLARSPIYFSINNWVALEENCDTIINDLDPEQYQGYLGKGIALSEQNRDEEALEVLNKAIELATSLPPDEKAEIYFARAVVFEKLENYNAAIYNYDSVVTFAPEDPRGYLGQGNALISAGSYFKAAQKFDYALELDDANPNAYIGQALARIGIGDRYAELDEYAKMNKAYENALKDCESALNLDEQDVYAYYYKGLALRNLRSYPDAIQAFDRALDLAKRQQPSILPNLYFEKGEACRLFGDEFKSASSLGKSQLDEAVNIFDQGIDHALKQSEETSPEENYLSLLFTSKGFALIDLGKFEKAVSAFENALNYDSKNFRARIGIGTAWYLKPQPDYEKAKEAFAEVVEFKMEKEEEENSSFDKESALLGLGLIYEKKENPEKANTAFEEAFNLQPQIPEFKRWINQAYIFDSFEEYKKAEKKRKDAVESNQESAHAHNEIAWMYVDKFGNEDEKLKIALQHAQQAVKLEEYNNGNWLDTLGWIYFKMGKYNDAKKYLGEAVAQNKYDELISFHFAETRKKLSETTFD